MTPIYDTSNDYTQTLNLRDAAERAARLYSENAAKDLYASAVSIGDTNLIDAIEDRAELKGWAVSPSGAAKTIHNAMVALVDDHKKAGIDLNEDIRAGLLTTAGLEAATAKFTQSGQYTARLDAIVDKAATAAAASAAKLQSAVDVLSTSKGGVQEQILDEMRATKAWDRIKAEITGNSKITSNATTIYELGKRITASSDPTTRRVILEESKSWLAGLGHPVDNSTDVLTYLTEQLIGSDPALSTLDAEAKAASKLAMITTHNAGKLRPRLSSVPPSFEQEKHGQEPTRSGRAGYIGPAEDMGSTYRTGNAVTWSARRNQR